MKFLILLAGAVLMSASANSQEAPEGLFIGSKAPDFKAVDQNGKEVRLKDELKKGKVILIFYRGQWCPYCSKFLSRLQDSIQVIADRGATVIAVGAESPENIEITSEKTKASFSIVHDEGLKILKAYDVEYEVPDNTIQRYKNGNIDIEKNNGANGKFLPVPAIYIIDEESTVTYRFFDTDYRKRPDISDLISQL